MIEFKNKHRAANDGYVKGTLHSKSNVIAINISSARFIIFLRPIYILRWIVSAANGIVYEHFKWSFVAE